MWKNMLERYRTQMTMWSMAIAFWIPRAADKFIIYNTYRFPTATLVARTHIIVTL